MISFNGHLIGDDVLNFLRAINQLGEGCCVDSIPCSSEEIASEYLEILERLEIIEELDPLEKRSSVLFTVEGRVFANALKSYDLNKASEIQHLLEQRKLDKKRFFINIILSGLTLLTTIISLIVIFLQSN